MGTVDEFREKGAIGALRDAALDARDMASDGLKWVGDGVKTAVEGDKELEAYLRLETMPARGATAPLEFSDGTIVEATVLEVDGVSDPPRVKVAAPGLEQPLLVSLLAPGAAFPQAAAQGGILDSLKEEVQGTVQDFREKGAVGAMKDAALDAVDIVSSTANTAISGAKSLAQPINDALPDMPDFWSTSEQAEGAQETAVTTAAPASSSSAPGPKFTAPAPAGPYSQTFPAPAPVGPPASAGPTSPTAAKVSAPTSPTASSQGEEKASAGSSDGKPGRKSLVSMRAAMFEKPKDEPKKEAEELID